MLVEITHIQKFLTLIAIIIAGCFIAGLYGIAHDQLTYTISPEYYTKFKFLQFALVEEGVGVDPLNSRILVSIVGFFATWWMGPPIAIVLGLFSLHSNWKTMMGMAMKAFLVVMAIAFITGLYGLYEGYAHLADQPREHFRDWFIPENLVDFRSFIAVGSMHNHSYLGGLYGLFGGIAYIGYKKGIVRMPRKEKGSAVEEV